jgi:flagellar protein FliS
MHAAASRATAAYQTTQVQSRTPLEQVVLLYDGAIGFLTRALDAVAHKDIRGRQRSISRAVAIVNHLQNTLNREAGGEIARALDALYSYTRERLLEANIKQQGEPIEEVLRLLGTLREGWADIAANPPRLHAVDRSQP